MAEQKVALRLREKGYSFGQLRLSLRVGHWDFDYNRLNS
jgi:hypothetical protein